MKRYKLACAVVAILAASSAARAEDLKLGIAGPFTGPQASYGLQLKNGAQQAVEDVNAKGGILGRKVTIVVGDDQADPKQGVSVANNFVGEGVKYVVGHFNSGVTIPASDVYQDNGILMITPNATNPTLTDKGKWDVFRTCGRDDQQGAVAAKYIADKFADKKIAVINDKTTYGKGLADATVAALAKLGIKPILSDGVNAGEKDYTAVVSKVKASGADLLYWGGQFAEGGLIRRQMADQGVKAVMMSGDGIADSEFASISGPSADGTLMTFPPDPRKKPDAAAVIKEFEAKNVTVEGYTLYSYAAVQVIAEAAEAAKTLDTKKVADIIHSGMTFHTVIGDLSYDKKGDKKESGYVLYTWKKQPSGEITYVESD